MNTQGSFFNRISFKGALVAAALAVAGTAAMTVTTTTTAQAAPGWHHGHGGHGHGHGPHRPRPPRHWGPGHFGAVVPLSLGIVSYTVAPECYVVKKKVRVPGHGRVWRPVTVCR